MPAKNAAALHDQPGIEAKNLHHEVAERMQALAERLAKDPVAALAFHRKAGVYKQGGKLAAAYR
ncbi:hypothetical protein [Pseudomonas sp. NPDC007930]|uniref:hypothetical protein n=1 Tax=Pseudomonas sp. NPDC007930 TaxID=3364417 RepID=UPI0036F18BDF